MDRTDLGILGTLPKFNRESRLVSPVPRVPDKQYIMRKPKSRSFLDCILTSAKGGGGLEYFNVSLKIGLWRKKTELVSLIFDYAGGIAHESFVVEKFMNACFALCSNTNSENNGDDDSDGDNHIQPRSLRVRNKFSNADVRRTLIEFGRCFVVGSIPGGLLRNSLSVDVSNMLSSALRRFFSCNHMEITTTAIDAAICQACCRSLFQAGRRAEETISPAARLACALADAAIYTQGNELRYLASVTADVIDRAIETRANYVNEFQENQGDDVRFYNGPIEMAQG